MLVGYITLHRAYDAQGKGVLQRNKTLCKTPFLTP